MKICATKASIVAVICHLNVMLTVIQFAARLCVFFWVRGFYSFYNPFCRTKCVLEFNLIFNGFCFVNGCVKVTAKIQCMFNTLIYKSVIKKGVVVVKSIINGFCMAIIFHCDHTLCRFSHLSLLLSVCLCLLL